MRNPVLGAVIALTTSAASAEPMWFQDAGNGGNCGECGWTIAEGEITKETPEVLRAFLAERGYASEFVLNSPGGNLGAALEMGRIIRESGSSTAIGRSVPTAGTPWYTIEDGSCESACAFAFLAGLTRKAYEEDGSGGWQPRTGILGMHQFYTPDGANVPSEDTQKLMGQVLQYIIEMGVDGGILSVAAQTPPDSMHFFTREELVDLGVLTFAGKRPFELTVVQGGLAYGWQEISPLGTITQDIRMRCSRMHGGWILSIRHYGQAFQTLGFDPDNPKDMGMAIAGQRHAMTKSHILDLGIDGEDRYMTVALPVDPTDFPGKEFLFIASGLRNWAYLLSAVGPFPEAATLDVLLRACGD